MKIKEISFNSKVKELLKKEPITNLNIVGALSYAEDIKVYVDREDQPTGVYVCADGLSFLYTQNLQFVDSLLEFSEENTSQQQVCFSGVKRELVDYIKEKYEFAWESPCDIYYYPKKIVDLSDVKSKVVTIPVEEAGHIDEYYTFRDDKSIYEIEANLRRRPSAGIYEDGKLVCWVMVHEDDSMGIMYTLDGYRRKGYAEEVSLVLIDQMLKLEKTPFIQIIETNQMSPGLAKKCGFVKAGKCSWFGLEIK